MSQFPTTDHRPTYRLTVWGQRGALRAYAETEQARPNKPGSNGLIAIWFQAPTNLTNNHVKLEMPPQQCRELIETLQFALTQQEESGRGRT